MTLSIDKVLFEIAREDVDRVIDCMEARPGIVAVHSNYKYSYFDETRCFAVSMTHKLMSVFWVTLGLVYADIENDVVNARVRDSIPDWSPRDLAENVQYIHRRGSGVTLAFPDFRIIR